MYIHEQKNWPRFSWDETSITPHLTQVRLLQGLLLGKMESIGFQLENEVVLESLTEEIVKSSLIEGELLNQSLVRSSVARHLGIESAASHAVDRNVEGVVEMMLDATQKFNNPLTKQRLFSWHAGLFPTGWSGITKIKVANWRKGSIQVVSGRPGKEVIHFEGPSADRVDHEMILFIQWMKKKTGIDLVLKAAVAHLWFVTIHPFDDGNGRIGRAIVDMLLAQSEQSKRRFYSLSSQIQQERKGYYQILEQTQKGELDLTQWIIWFLECLARAIQKALSTLKLVKKKEFFWENLRNVPLNDRQRTLLNLLLEGFKGKLTSSKWAKIAKCSQDSAYRDINDLIQRGILIKNPEGGRSTSYAFWDRFKAQVMSSSLKAE